MAIKKRVAESTKTVISKSTGLPVDPKRSRAARKAAATRKANALVKAANTRSLRLHHKILAGGAIFAVLVFTFLGIKSQLETYAASTATGTFVGIGGKCIDNAGAKLAVNNSVRLYTCNGTVAQKWVLTSSGSLMANAGATSAGKSYCIDVPGNSTAEYTYIRLYTCNDSAAQHFTVKNNTLVGNTTGFCATDHYAETTNGNKIWMKACHGSDAQKWVYSGTASGSASPSTVTAPTSGSSGGTSSGSGGASTGSGTQQTGGGISLYQNLSGSTFSSRVNAAGTGNMVSLASGTYTFSDFKDGQAGTAQGVSSYGALISAKGLLGAGVDKTIIQMNANTSSKKAAVPPSCGGGTSCPTNNLYLVSLKTAGAKFDGITLKGTSQGHYYNGLRFEQIASPTLSNTKITAIPGGSSANPDETFFVNFQRASGSATIKNVTIDGGGVGAAGIAMNTSSANFDINNLNTTNLKYSAGIALWQETGTLNIHGWSNTNSARALGAERLAATVNLYDPSWGTPTTGHDITLTPYPGQGNGRINFYLTKAPARKFIILTNTATVKSWVHVYMNNVEQTQSNYVTWQGA